MMLFGHLLNPALQFLPVATAGEGGFEEKCAAFKAPDLVSGSTLNELHFVAAGTNLTFPHNDPSCDRASQIVPVDLCRVALAVPTSKRSSIIFELWLPENWSGRTLATGNGGIDGCIKYEDIAYGASNGFARYVVGQRMERFILFKASLGVTHSSTVLTAYSFGANNGHSGTHGDAFYKNEDVLIDFAWRSLHTSVDIGKELTASFYGRRAHKSYYIGCSLGGRQGIGSAERFPRDFDGIVAGAPAVDFNNLYSWRARFFTITGGSDAMSFIPPDAWKTTIHDEVLRQCDEIDGVRDGIIEDPTLCHFRPEKLLCGAKGSRSPECLTAEQIRAVNTIFTDYFWPNGSLLYPAMQPGNEVMAADGLYSGQTFSPSVDWFKFVVLDDPSWDPSSYTVEDALLAAQADTAHIRTWPSSLAAFSQRGGKLLMHHGQQDQQISSFNSARFYEHLAHGMDYKPSQMDEFLRFIRIPGMNHCQGGPGAWTIGQGGTGASYGIPFDESHNILAAVVDWVEKDVPPDSLVGTKFVDDNVSVGVEYRHRHCRYPYRSTYKGPSHDPKDVDSWECLEPDSD
ncbi:tannase and feruloyl esterase [Xylariomycetidae sp. FL0641]|nr:tannase and feruloyl esterase [Xylariomycetidae sp. FL0641]